MSKFLRPYKVLRSFAIPVLLLLLVGILLSRGTAVIITDPVWNELYLQQGRRSFLIKKELGKNLYLPSTNIVPTDTDVEALRDRISSSRARLFLLSPLLSRPFLSTGLWEDFPDRDFIVISFGESVPSLAAKNLIVLSAGGEGLVQKVFELLKVLGDDRNSTGKILVLRDNSSWVDQDTIELLREKIESELPEAEVRFFDSADGVREMETTQDSAVLFFPGFGGDNLELLSGVSQQGGRSIITGDEYGLVAWPDSVYAVVVPDLEKTLSVVLEEGGGEPGNGEYPILFSVKRGKD